MQSPSISISAPLLLNSTDIQPKVTDDRKCNIIRVVWHFYYVLLRIIRPHHPYYVCRCGLLLPTEYSLSVCHNNEPCKHGWTNRDAVCFEDLGRPRNHVLDGGPHPPWKGAFWGEKRRPIVKYRYTLRIRSSVQKWLNRLICRLGCRVSTGMGISRGVSGPLQGTGFWELGKRVSCT